MEQAGCHIDIDIPAVLSGNLRFRERCCSGGALCLTADVSVHYYLFYFIIFYSFGEREREREMGDFFVYIFYFFLEFIRVGLKKDKVLL